MQVISKEFIACATSLPSGLRGREGSPDGKGERQEKQQSPRRYSSMGGGEGHRLRVLFLSHRGRRLRSPLSRR